MLKLPSLVVKCANNIVYALLRAILPVSAPRRLHGSSLRRQSTGGVSRRTRALIRHDAGDCEGDEFFGDDVRAACRADGNRHARAHLHAWFRAADGGPSD